MKGAFGRGWNDPVLQAFDAYRTDRGVCLLIVRDRKAVISINGIV